MPPASAFPHNPKDSASATIQVRITPPVSRPSRSGASARIGRPLPPAGTPAAANVARSERSTILAARFRSDWTSNGATEGHGPANGVSRAGDVLTPAFPYSGGCDAGSHFRHHVGLLLRP